MSDWDGLQLLIILKNFVTQLFASQPSHHAYLVITLKVKIDNQITKNKPGPKVFDYSRPI